MTIQRKTHIKTQFKKALKSLTEKLELIPKKERIRVVAMRTKLGKYDCIIFYDFKKSAFTQINVIEETIEL